MAVTFDQASVLNRMIDSLQVKESVNSVILSSTSVPILSIVAEEISELAKAEAYYKRETKWDKAQNLASLIYQSRFRGYEAKRKQGAVGSVLVSNNENFNVAYSQDIIFPKFTKFSSASGTNFSSTTTTTLASTASSVTVPIVQGSPKSYSYSAAGTALEKIQVMNDSIDENYFELYVNDFLWTVVENIEESGSSDRVYEIHNIGDFEGVELVFGNNIYGRKLEAGDVVLFKYIETLGESGNVSGLGVVNSVSSSIYDVNGLNVSVYCKNEVPIIGGKDFDDIEYIRKKGLQSFIGADKAVTTQGYQYQITQSQFVEKAVVWGAYEYNKDLGNDPWDFIPSSDNVIRISAYNSLGLQLSSAEKTAIIKDLVDRKIKPPADILQFIDVEFIGLEFHIAASVLDTSVVLSDLQVLIRNSLASEYGLDNQQFKTPIYDTQWKAFVSDIEGVYYHNSYIRLVAYDSFDSAYVCSFDLLRTSISSESIKVYAKNNNVVGSSFVLIATSDVDGNWTPESGYTLSGSVNYLNGSGTIIVTSGLSGDFSNYEIKIFYIPSSLNFILTQRNQIFKLESVSDVVVQYVAE